MISCPSNLCCIIEPPRSETGSLKASSPLAVSPLPVFSQSLCASTMAVALVLLLAAVATDAVSPPRAHVSFVFDSPDRPLVRFPLVGVRNCTALLLSEDRDTLYVGARDTVLSLDVSGSEVITLKRKVSWPPTDSDVNDCRRKGKDATADCGNFVSVLQHLNASHVYACGSFAFAPRDTFLDANTLAMTPPRAARGRCPFSPTQRSAALVADGELFTAATNDFKGVTPLIARHFSKDGRPDVIQDSSPILLEEANFVGSALDSARRKVFFFFSELANEFNVEERLQVARVASVCQDDVGGAQILQKKWTSLVKTTLRCLAPFRVLRDVFALAPPEGGDAAHTLFYAIFVSQWSLRSESAVCSFRLASLRAAFAGSYRSFDTSTHLWSPLLAKSSYFGQCGLEGAPHANLEEVKRTFLTGGSIAPETGGPLVVSAHLRYSRVAAMSVRGADGRRHQVLFLLTESGLLHKVFLSARGPRLIEEIAVLESGERVTAFVLSTAKGLAFVGSWGAVTAVPVARCSAHSTCGRCLLARDPLCGWSQSRKLCARLDQEQPEEDKEHMVQLLEGGDVAKECRGEGGTRPVKNVVARANEVVKLPCDKPWESSTLTWTSSRFRVLPPHLFIRSDDSSLNFLASGDTVGTYRCQAEEDGYTETVASYDVIQSAAPRSVCADCGVEVQAESSSPPTPLCERRGSRGGPVGVALVMATCICFLMSVAILACVRRKSAARHEGPPRGQEGKCEFRVSEPRVELRQLTDTPA
ncbi:semaphorin-4A-like isoform X2 [Phyllopteryx taeniolatus]|uniref:semaphorin-4A-like isoform X2 n=1 Tax=Phyllopteryx taeniolatus TaxID=161469 RepID=UPI002AD4E0B2|nr:semaphorin-4A-like isoform X2 [Phyllopteryx taeniolatus]